MEVAKLNAKIPAEPRTINLRSDDFDICFDYDFFSNKSIVTMSHGISIKLEGSSLRVRLGFKENEILGGPTPIASPFMENMERYAALYACTDIIQNQLVGYVRALLLRLAPVKSRYGDTTCVTYEQSQFLPLNRSHIQTMYINIKSDTGELVSFESGKLIATLVFRRIFYCCIDYQHLKEHHVKEVVVLVVSSKS